MRFSPRFVCLIVLSIVAASPAAWAQQGSVPSRLSLDDAIRLARERNPRVHAARSMVDAARGERVDVSRWLNPAISFESESYPLFEPGRPSFANNQELTFRIDQEFETGGRRRLRTAAAEATVASADALLRDEERRLSFDVQRAYFAIVLAEEDLRVAQGVLDDIDELIALNRARVEQGEISGLELRRLQVERLRFVDDVFAAQLAVRNTKSALLALLAADDLARDFEVTEPLAVEAPETPAQDRTALDVRALAARPDLAAAREEVRRADTETRLQRALRAPNVTVGGGYKRDFGINSVVVGVTVPLQIFNRNQGGIARAEAERRRAESLADAAAIEVRLELQQALNAVETNRTRVDYIEQEHLQNAEVTRETVLASYRLGATTLIDYLDAQRAFRDTRRTYNRALFDYRLSLFELAAAVGAPAITPREE